MIRKLRMIFTRRQKLKFLILFGMLFTGSVLAGAVCPCIPKPHK